MNNVKSATTAGLLGIFLGAFGAHNWYLGEKTKGIIHVALAGGGMLLYIIADFVLPAILSWRSLSAIAWLIVIMNLVASVVSMGNGIWGFVEGITILVQGDLGLMRKGFAVVGSNMQGQYQQTMQNTGYGNGYSGGALNGNYNNMQQNNMNNWDNNYGSMPQMGNGQPMNVSNSNSSGSDTMSNMKRGGNNAE